MKVLVTGCAGMLGSALIPALVEAGYQVLATDIRHAGQRPWGKAGPRVERMDVRSADEVETWIRRYNPQVVAHLAAETDLEVCEGDPAHAFATNTEGTRNVAIASKAAGCTLVYISTAGVFDGEKPGPYTEDDQPRPISVYGSSKWLGEQLVGEVASDSYTVRAGWMVGGDRRDHKFVAKIVAQLHAGARTIHAVGDRFGSPTYAPDFSRCLVQLLRKGRPGLYHMVSRVSQGTCSRYDVARRIVHALGLADTVEVVEVSSDFFAEEYSAPRPRSEMLLNTRLDRLGLNSMRPWQESLDEYLKTAFRDLALLTEEGAMSC